MSGLFGSLFSGAAGPSAGGGLFSASSKYATVVVVPPAAAAAGGSGGSKKQKRQAADEAHPPADAAAERVTKKPRKAKQQAEAAAAAATAKQEKRKKRAAGDGAEPPEQPAKPAKQLQQPKQAKKQAAAADATDAEPKRKAGRPVAAGGKPKGGGAAQPDEDERLPRTVFVGNLPSTVKRKALTKLFAGCGAVESVRLRSLPLKQDAESKVPRRGVIAAGKIDTEHSAHAYVVFKAEESVEQALQLNMAEFEGHHLRVDRAAPRAAKGAVQFDAQRSLFVGNLSHDVEDEELIRHFGAAGVEAVRVVRDPKTGEGKGVAFVLFRTQDACTAARRQKGGAELKGRKLRLDRVKKMAAADGKAAAWQQGKGSDSKGGKAAKPASSKRKAGGKRPAVAARKQVARAAAKAGGVLKKRAA